MGSTSAGAAPFVPKTISLTTLRKSAASCRGCPLYLSATQTVFGEGNSRARIVLVGEAPGDQEDQKGHPFIGPAGQFLSKCLANAGISEKDIYVTNAVKHFKFIQKGKRRLHQKPSVREISACRPWLEQELEIIHPNVLICLGTTAARAVIGKTIPVTRHHGQKFSISWCANTMVTFHPSAALRAPTEEGRSRTKAIILHDFKIAARWLHESVE